MPFSWLDIILIAIMLNLGLSPVRGFTREVLSVFFWAVAAVAALYLTPKCWEVLQPISIRPTSSRWCSPPASSLSR